ncbi:MAG TPA: peptide ABC transporter substrate-binding protein [Candidatus Baltobacteraceae bacterium]|nr:peptide ABC transporter substrate-binding protein [Candidatus Baltobacteraceae bacterium]
MTGEVRALALAGGFLLGAGCTHAPPPGTTVRFDVAADPVNLNPLFALADAGQVAQQLAHLSFEPFYDLDAKGRAVPELLERVPSVENGGVSRDGRTIVYHLRRNVRWSDGVPLGARDVLFTVAAIRDARNPVGSREGWDLIDRIDALDGFTVRVHLRRAWAPAVAAFFGPGTSPQYVLPAHVLAREASLARAPFNAAPSVGDGPFSFVEWRRGDRLLYRANPRYWRGRPRVDRLEIRIVPDPQTNLNLLQTGEIDFNLIAPAQEALLRKSAPELAYVAVPTALIAGIALNLEHAPLDDPAVRRALVESVDRAGISRKITFGRYPVADSDRPRFSWAYDPSVREPDYDPGRADDALEAAGWKRGPSGMRSKNGRPLELTYVQFPETTTGVRVATVVQAELRLRGIDVTLKSISNAQLFLPASEGGILASGRFDLAYVPWAMGADPDDRFLLGCGRGGKNYMRFCDPAVERLEDEAVAHPSQTYRRTRYVAIDRIVAASVPIVYLFNPTYVYAYGKHLRGFAPNAFSPTWDAYDWSRP